MKLVPAAVAFLVCAGAARAVAQDTTGVRGIRPPSELHGTKVGQQDFRDLVLSVKVLVDTLLRVHGLGPELRVISAWGGYAGLPCDCLTTRLFIGLNDGEEFLVAYSLPELLDPTIDRVTTQGRDAVVFISYGLDKRRQHARIRANLDGMWITGGSP